MNRTSFPHVPRPGYWASDSSPALAALAGCAAVATGYLLGADWLAWPSLGLPVGIWAVTLVWALARRDQSRRDETAGRSSAATSTGVPIQKPGLGSDVLGLLMNVTSRLAGFLAGWKRPQASAIGQGLDALLAAIPWRRQAVRVGVAIDGAWDVGDARRAVNGGPGFVRVAPMTASARAFDAMALDALIALDSDQRAVILTPERPGKDASWYDWGTPRPVSYSSVFPIRLDCLRVSLGRAGIETREGAELVRALASAAGTLARHPRRLVTLDLVRGRFGSAVTSGSHPVLHALASEVKWAATAGDRSPAARAAARVVSAWLSQCATRFTDRQRLAGMESCAAVAGDEPELMLRLGAVRLACMDDLGGIDALRSAAGMLRDAEFVSPDAQFAFVQSELETGVFGPLALGRVAAGICMLCAGVTADRVAFLRDDLLDDMRYCGWLVGRDQDRKLLLEVFRAMEWIKRADAYGLPESKAA